MIILEGPDGGGKSTLAELLCETLGYAHLRSEGPEKYPGEINKRIERYFSDYGNKGDVIFDRHPCVSQIAYGIVHDQPQPSNHLVSRFYRHKPLLIYCRPDPANVRHTASGEWDTPEFQRGIQDNYTRLMKWYDNWAIWNANHIYRIGDSIKPIEELIKGWRRAI